jgi:hypothetical protein
MVCTVIARVTYIDSLRGIYSNPSIAANSFTTLIQRSHSQGDSSRQCPQTKRATRRCIRCRRSVRADRADALCGCRGGRGGSDSGASAAGCTGSGRCTVGCGGCGRSCRWSACSQRLDIRNAAEPGLTDTGPFRFIDRLSRICCACG